MFSNQIKPSEFETIRQNLAKLRPSVRDIELAVQKGLDFERLSEADLAILLSDKALELRPYISKAAHIISQQRHGRVVRFYSPIYVSNECTNRCAYCGFNSSNRIDRITLSMDQVLTEARAIKQMGIEHLLIVSGEDTSKVSLEYLKRIATELSGMFCSVNIEISPLEQKDYDELFNKGIDGVICYQETYDPASYDRYHLAGPKKDITRRLDTLDRAGSAGMRSLGLGVLLGLWDYRAEAYFLAKHARYLEKKYWRSQLSVSFPRIRDCSSGFKPPFPVSDEQLLLLISVLRLYLPDANLLISTRESQDFREQSVFAGINQMSAGSRTQPLGHSLQDHGKTSPGKQFEIADKRSPYEISKRLHDLGYDPVFKDWDKGFRQ